MVEIAFFTQSFFLSCLRTEIAQFEIRNNQIFANNWVIEKKLVLEILCVFVCVLQTLLIMNMSVKCAVSPPQTYSRLFRPWDGKTQQDNTITSTTMQLQQNPKSTNSSEQIDHMIVCSDKKTSDEILQSKHCSPKIDGNNAGAVAINESSTLSATDSSIKLTANQLPPSLQQMTGFFPATPFFPQPPPPPAATSFQDFVLPNLPFIGVDPFVMEQEYARVLAEEAQVKMMTARKQRPKKFKCPHCEVAFSNNGQLKGHIRIHTGTFYQKNINLYKLNRMWSMLHYLDKIKHIFDRS